MWWQSFASRGFSTLTGVQAFALLAEVAVNPPADPWTVGGVLGGATVMGILTWIFGSYIPRKDKFIETLIANHNKELRDRDKLKQEETAALRAELTTGRAQFIEALKTVQDHCAEEISRVHGIYDAAAKLSRDSIEWETQRTSPDRKQGG